MRIDSSDLRLTDGRIAVARGEFDEGRVDRPIMSRDNRSTGGGRRKSDWMLSMPAPTVNETLSTAGSSADVNATAPAGLTSDEARRRLEQFGLNAMPDTSAHPLRMALEKLWAPVPWMLEAAIVLELSLGKYVEASVVAVLLVFNAALGDFQESHARATLTARLCREQRVSSFRA